MDITINCEAWEPCEYCKEPSCDNCLHQWDYVDTHPCGDTDLCPDCENMNHWEPFVDYCYNCGRPMTDAAWAALEERLRRCAE